VACRNVGIGSRVELVETLKNATFPVPHVEHVEAVANIKFLFNPSDTVQFLHGPINYPRGTSLPLHFLFVKDASGRAVIRDKPRYHFDNWSDPFCIWSNNAVLSGLKVESIKGMPSVELSQQ
jgi:hypothetical protein